MARRYEIKETLDKDGIREFSVGYPEQKDYERVGVWVSRGVASCTACSGLLRAMLSSCPHAKAVSRFLKLKPAVKRQRTVSNPIAVEILVARHDEKVRTTERQRIRAAVEGLAKLPLTEMVDPQLSMRAVMKVIEGGE